MKEVPPFETTTASPSAAPVSAPNMKLYALAVAALIALFLIANTYGTSEIRQAINLSLVIAALALGTKFGFQWVSAATDADPDSPTVVATRPDALQAGALVSKLEQHGITAFATGSHTSGFQVEIASSVKIVVSKRDADKAREVLGDAVNG